VQQRQFDLIFPVPVPLQMENWNVTYQRVVYSYKYNSAASEGNQFRQVSSMYVTVVCILVVESAEQRLESSTYRFNCSIGILDKSIGDDIIFRLGNYVVGDPRYLT
jgi:hypothetical protein